MKRKPIILAVGICIMSGLCLPVFQAEASSSTVFKLEEARKLALEKSRDYKKIMGKRALKEAEYAQAVKSNAEKQRDMRTFRWSPLLSFKFPEQPALADSYEWQYKPVQIQTNIRALNHEAEDVKYEVAEEISNLYVKAYTLQEQTAFTGEQILELENTAARSGAKVKVGKASSSDVEKMKKTLEKKEQEQSLNLKELELVKGKIKNLTGKDLSTGYTFSNPLVTAGLGRDTLDGLTQYMLEHDQSFFEAKLNTSLGKLSLEINEQLMKSQYGDKMNSIQPYITQAKQGIEIDEAAFKLSYDKFLEAIDSPWQGNFRILFIKIPKEWFKGEIDGIRYVEDEPYALYTAALEYQDYKSEQDSLENELRERAADDFEALMTAKNAYDEMKKAAVSAEEEVTRGEALNRAGKMSYEELAAVQEGYEEAQMDTLEALSDYSELLYSFDRFTCGGVTEYLEKESLDGSVRMGGDSWLTAQEQEGASYYIESQVEDNVFVFGLSIPDDYGIALTDYELWVDGTQIGARTPVSGTIRHLTFTARLVEKASVRLYNGEQFVDECEIDPLASSGQLTVTGEYKLEHKKEEKAVASYKLKKDGASGMAEFTMKKYSGEEIAYYKLTDKNGSPLYKDELVKEGESFRYLSFLAQDAGDIRVNMYDSGKNLLYEGWLDPDTMQVMAERESE